MTGDKALIPFDYIEDFGKLRDIIYRLEDSVESATDEDSRAHYTHMLITVETAMEQMQNECERHFLGLYGRT